MSKYWPSKYLHFEPLKWAAMLQASPQDLKDVADVFEREFLTHASPRKSFDSTFTLPPPTRCMLTIQCWVIKNVTANSV
jgi:hypothetical protein